MKAFPFSFHTLSLADLVHVARNLLTMSSSHLIFGRALSLSPSSGIHSVIRLVHLLSVILATCPAQHHFSFLACASISCTPDLLRIQVLCLRSLLVMPSIARSILLCVVLSLSCILFVVTQTLCYCFLQIAPFC